MEKRKDLYFEIQKNKTYTKISFDIILRSFN